MRLGSKKLIVLIYFSIFFNISSIAEDKILRSPLINLNELKPSFEEVEETVTNKIDNEAIKNKKKSSQQNNVSSAHKHMKDLHDHLHDERVCQLPQKPRQLL